MIQDALTYIREELRAALGIQNLEDVQLGAIHRLDKRSDHPGVSISVVNVSEETTLKNSSHYVRVNQVSVLQEPPVHLNLCLLFSFNMTKYEDSLSHLSNTVELFQSKRRYDAAHQSATNPFPASLEKLIFDIHTFDFDDMHRLWSSLGGGYFPSILYKVRLVAIQKHDQVAAPEIVSVELQSGGLQ